MRGVVWGVMVTARGASISIVTQVRLRPPPAGTMIGAPVKALLFEPDHTGHHFAYVRLMLAPLLELFEEVVLYTGSRARESRELAAQLGRLSERVTVDYSAPPLHDHPIRSAAERARALARAIGEHRPDHLSV